MNENELNKKIYLIQIDDNNDLSYDDEQDKIIDLCFEALKNKVYIAYKYLIFHKISLKKCYICGINKKFKYDNITNYYLSKIQNYYIKDSYKRYYYLKLNIKINKNEACSYIQYFYDHPKKIKSLYYYLQIEEFYDKIKYKNYILD